MRKPWPIASFVAVVALTGSLFTANAQQPPTPPDAVAMAQLDGFVLGLTEADRFSGVVLVARDGRILLEKAYGKRDAEKDGSGR